MRYPLNERRVRVGFAFGDAWFNTGKLHTGEDDHATAGEPVYASANGVVYNHTYDPKWGNGVILAFDGGDGTCIWHVDHLLPDGTHVSEGDRIATVYDLQGNTHLHVSFWVGQYDSHLTVGALPPSQFPDRFVEPDHYLDSHPDKTTGDDDMPKLIVAGDTGEIFVTDGVFKRYIGNPGEANELAGLFGAPVKVSQYTVDRFPTLAGDDEGHPSHAGNPDLSIRELKESVADIGNKLNVLFSAPGDGGGSAMVQTVRHIQDKVDQGGGGTGGGGLSAAQAQLLQDTHDTIGRVEAALKGA